MPELWLKFKDEYGDFKRILVEQERFTIGRTPDNDLGVSYNNISRQHVLIEQVEDGFLVSDCGSSNGTTLNNENLYEPTALNNGDTLNVGGWLEIEIELISKAKNVDDEIAPATENVSESDAENSAGEKSSAASAGGSTSSSSAAAGSGSSFSFGWLLLAPVLVLLVLFIGGGILLVSGVFGGKPNTPPNKTVDITKNNGDDNDDSPTPEKSKTPVPVESATPLTNPTASTSPDNGSSTPGSTTPGSTTPTTLDSPQSPSTPKVADDREKVRNSSALLLRRIATRDSNAFLTVPQATFVVDKIKSFKGTSALAENLKDAKKNTAKIGELAKSKNLTPQFLLVATLTELDTKSGSVVGKATEILESLADLSREFGGEVSDDSLLVIAATSQSKSGELLNTIGKASTEFPNSPVRSIWFLHDKNKLTPPQFDKVLRFLAIGTMAQNPKDFNISAEAVSF